MKENVLDILLLRPNEIVRAFLHLRPKGVAMKNKTRLITGTAMLTALAVGLQYIEISIPIMPSFIKLDFSDLPEIIGAFAYGPLAGVVIALLKNLIHMAVSQSGFVGELSNFILGAVFSLVAGLIYKTNKTKKTALLAGVIASLSMALVSILSNRFIIYPLYYSVLGLPENAVLDMYQLILPSVKSVFEAILIFNTPFTFIKGLLCLGITMLIYKPLSPILKGKRD